MNHADVAAIVLAAGKGTRMKSDLPKVMHEVAGRSMLARVADSLKGAGVTKVCAVISEELGPFQSFIDEYPDVVLCIQKERKGTADAVGSAAGAIRGAHVPPYSTSTILRGDVMDAPYVLICTGDTPAMESEVLAGFVSYCKEAKADIGVLGMRVPDPFGYGRMLMADGDRIERIVEERDADEVIRKVDLCNSGVFFGKAAALFEALAEVGTVNSQGEYYLTDIVAIGNHKGKKVIGFATDRWQGFLGVNDIEQKARVEQIILERGR